MKYFVYFIFIAFCMIGNPHVVIAMHWKDSESLAMQKFVGQELTVLTLVDSSIEQKKSLNFVINEKIIAIFNYKKRQVITYFDEENHCKFPYMLFKEMVKNQLENREFPQLQERDLLQKKSEEKNESNIRKAYSDTCACCIS